MNILAAIMSIAAMAIEAWASVQALKEGDVFTAICGFIATFFFVVFVAIYAIAPLVRWMRHK